MRNCYLTQEISKKKFEDALKTDEKNVEAFFGLARLGEKLKKPSIYQNAVNDLLYSNNDYIPALVEKCRMAINLQDFELLKEAYTELLKSDKKSVMGYIYWTFYLLVNQGNLDEAREKYEKLVGLINEQEPDNMHLMMLVAKLMSRICGRATVILTISIRIIEKCRQLDSMAIEPILELANNFYMIENYSQAFNLFKMAASMNMDSSELSPMIGILKTQMAKGEMQEAEMQLPFFTEMLEGEKVKSAEGQLIQGMLISRKNIDKKNLQALENMLQESNRALDDCLKNHISAQKKLSQNLEFYIALNPDFLLTLCNELLYHSDFNLNQLKARIQNPITPTHLIKKAIKLLETTIKKVPGLIPAYMLSSKAKLIIGDVNGALQLLQKALEFDPKNEEAYILNAIVLYANGNVQTAYGSIKEALANNFDMDKNPFFMMLKGEMEIKLGEVPLGLKTLEKAFNIPGIQSGEGVQMKKRSRYMTVISFNENVRSQIYVEYAKALASDKQNKKAKEIMEQAIMEFAGTDDEPVVLLGNADIAIISGDLKKALNILRSVEPMAKGYLEARGKLADIYLNKMLNRRQYAKCYFDLVQVFPNFENYKKYGDALLQIQEPDKAIEAYQEALKIDPNNQFIVRAIGKALSITHNYQLAIEYYEEAIQNHPNNDDLKLDHAKLLVKNNFIDVLPINSRKPRRCWTGTHCWRWRKRSLSRA